MRAARASGLQELREVEVDCPGLQGMERIHAKKKRQKEEEGHLRHLKSAHNEHLVPPKYELAGSQQGMRNGMTPRTIHPVVSFIRDSPATAHP